MIIDLNKKYITLYKYEVRLFDIINDEVFGVANYLGNDVWLPLSWSVFDGSVVEHVPNFDLTYESNLPLILAHERGELIQEKLIGNNDEMWVDTLMPDWRLTHEYRIKPKEII